LLLRAERPESAGGGAAAGRHRRRRRVLPGLARGHAPAGPAQAADPVRTREGVVAVVSTVLVTGGNGMLGGNLVRRLHRDGHHVRSVDLREPAEPLPGVSYTVADVRDAGTMATVMSGVDAVIHTAAALPSYPADQIRSVIVDGTRTTLAAARRAGVERVVHISSTAVYGLPKVVPTTEEHPRAPVDTYSRAKAAAEEVCDEFRADGMCVPVLRPKTFLGPGRLGLFA